jgi:hypothetical protein
LEEVVWVGGVVRFVWFLDVNLGGVGKLGNG